MNKEYTDKDGKIYIARHDCPRCTTGRMEEDDDGYSCVNCGHIVYIDRYNPQIEDEETK